MNIESDFINSNNALFLINNNKFDEALKHIELIEDKDIKKDIIKTYNQRFDIHKKIIKMDQETNSLIEESKKELDDFASIFENKNLSIEDKLNVLSKMKES